MNERLENTYFKTPDVLQLAAFAIAGTCFAFSAGGHEVYEEKALNATVMHDEKQTKDKSLIATAVLECAAIGKCILIIHKKPRP